MLMNGLFNLHSYILDRKEHIKKYLKIRKTEGIILDRMVSELEKDKYPYEVSKEDVNTANKIIKINLNKIKKYMYDDKNLYYNLFMFGDNSLANTFLEKKIYGESFKLKILKAMKNAKTGIFDIIKTDLNNGYVTLKGIRDGKEYTVVDKAMSVNEMICGKIYLYSRIIDVDNILMNNCVIPLDINNKEVKNLVNEYKKDNMNDVVLSLCAFEIMNSKNNKVGFDFR